MGKNDLAQTINEMAKMLAESALLIKSIGNIGEKENMTNILTLSWRIICQDVFNILLLLENAENNSHSRTK